jgi:group I intron endonuclease
MNRGIYMITNLINGKKYIGQGYISTRISKHKKGIGSKIVANAIKEYGIENFEFKTLVICEDSDMDYYETSLIKSYDTIAPNGYNVATGIRTQCKGHKFHFMSPLEIEQYLGVSA